MTAEDAKARLLELRVFRCKSTRCHTLITVLDGITSDWVGWTSCPHCNWVYELTPQGARLLMPVVTHNPDQLFPYQ